jgi:hypothetical protein
MTSLIQDVRVLANVGPTDYTVGGTISYWSDDQIQTILDQHRMVIRGRGLRALTTNTGGTISYTEYLSELSSWEDSPVLRDGFNAIVTGGTAVYSFDTNIGQVTFVNNTNGLAYSITGAVYDLNATAAEIWQRKAAYVASKYDVSTDNHSLSRSQLSKQYLGMARTFAIMPPSWTRGEGSVGSGSLYVEREDMTCG